MAHRVEYKSPSGRIRVVFDAGGDEELIKRMGQLQIILENDTCRACQDLDRDPTEYGAALEYRAASGYDFYGMKCQHPECGARLEFGVRKTDKGGGFFVKRQDHDKATDKWTPIEHGGWTWYRGETASAPQPQSTAPVATPSPPAAPAAPPMPEDDVPF